MIYILAISFQLAGALLLMVNVLSTRRDRVIRRFVGKGILYRDNNTNEISYDEKALKDTFKEAYLSKFAFLFIAVGYVLGVFESPGNVCRELMAGIIVLVSVFIIAISHLIVCAILKFSKKVNRKLTNQELIALGIEPDIENISNEEIDKLFRENR